MTRRIIAIFLLALAMTVTAGAAELTDARKQEVIARINSAVSRLHTMSCSFVHTKHLSLLSDKMVSE